MQKLLIENISKKYKEVNALTKLSFRILGI